MKLRDRVAIVTGAGVGIGVAYAERLAAEGAKVVCTDVNGDHAERTAKEIVAKGGDAIGFKADVTLKGDTEEMARRAKDQHGRIDILVNNAALFTGVPQGPFDEIDEDVWDACMEVNLKGIWNCIRSVFPYMKEQRYGKIINISSNTWMSGRPMLLSYVTSKAGVVGLTRAIAPEVGAHGINVNAILPGFCRNESTERAYEGHLFDNVRERQIFKRTLTPEDLCGAVVFFASDDAEMITGQALVIDGGMVFH